MKYRHTDYTINGQVITLTGVTTVTNADIRLIVDETAKIVICSTMQKDNVTCSDNTITVPSSVATLDGTHDYTIELDFGDSAEANRKSIKGADSTRVFDCGSNIPGCDFDDCYDIKFSNDKHYMVAESGCLFPNNDMVVGDVVRATEVDPDDGYMICVGYKEGGKSSLLGDVANGNGVHYLINGDGTLQSSAKIDYVAVEPGKSYRCKEIVTVKLLRIGDSSLSGDLFVFEEYDGDSIKDAKEEILDAMGELTGDLALESSVSDGNDTAIGMLKDQTNGLAAIKTQAASAASDAASVKTLVGTPASGQPSTLFAAIAAGGGGDAQESTSQAILAAVNSIIDAHLINEVSIDGYTFMQGFTPQNPGSILFDRSLLISIVDNNATKISGSYAFYGCNNVQYFSMPNIEEITGSDSLRYMTLLTSLSFPKLRTINAYRAFEAMTNLRELYLPELTTLSATQTYNCTNLRVINVLKIPDPSNVAMTSNPNLIDIIAGQGFAGNVSMSNWNPTNALSSSSSSLVEEGETFANNLEKLLYNIREHLAANMPDRTGQSALTFTFNANVKAAINADAATAAAFTNKNWTIA